MQGQASQNSTIINLINTVLGAGMLALPFAFREMGIVLATATILLAGLTTGIGLLFQGYCAGFLPKGQASFFRVSRITYPTMAVVFDLAIAFKCFGVSVSYLVINADLMPMVCQYFGAAPDSWFTSRFVWCVVAIAIVGPLSYQKTLDSLKTASLIALSSVVYLVIVVVGHFLRRDTLDDKGPVSIVEPTGGVKGILTSLPIIIFAFTCAQNMFSSLNEMHNDSVASTLFVVTFCMSSAAAVYIVVGLAGYLSFGNNVGNNIIAMYSQSVWSTLGRAAIVVLVLFSYPLMCHPARASIMNVIVAMRTHAQRSTQREDRDVETTALIGEQPHTQVQNSAEASLPAVSEQEHAMVTSLLLLGSFILALTVSSLDVVLSFVGSTGATVISFILPGVFVYSLAQSNHENRLVSLTPRKSLVVKWIAVILSLWGMAVMVLCLGMNIAALF